MKSELDAPHFADEAAAIEYVEARFWPDGAVCPHCGTVGEASRSKGKTTRPGLWNCRACRKPFTVRMKTIFESSHVPMRIWLQAIYLICSSKKGVSTRQIQRTLGGSMKTAWFLMHRIRHAMGDSSGTEPLGGTGKIVEADETFITRSPKSRRPKDAPHRESRQVVSLVERGGPIRSKYLDQANVRDVLWRHLDFNSMLYTDGAVHYRRIMPEGRHAPLTTPKKSGSAATCIRIRLKTSSRSSNADLSACISTSKSSTLTAIWRSSISATTLGPSSGLTIPNVQIARLSTLRASG